MTGNELYEPLKGRPTRGPRHRAAGLAALLCVLLSGSIGWLVLARSHDGIRGGEPQAVGEIVRAAPQVVASIVPPPSPSPASSPAETGSIRTAEPSQAAAASAAPFTGQSVEIQNGVKIYRPVFGSGSGLTVLKVPQGVADAGSAIAPRIAPDVRLVEPGSYGPLPRIGADGSRPAEVYAGARGPEGSPKVALLIGGLGFDRATTARASADLPRAVTLGFAPYGEDLAGQVRVARDAGHEIVLQLPMEGFGKTDPPTHMLTTDVSKLADNLSWLLSRFSGYAGVSNLRGGRLLASEPALRPLAEQIAKRGLYFLEDGTVAQSHLEPIGREIGLTSTHADVVIDVRSNAATVANDLTRLESMARDRGVAIGTAIGGPETLQAVAQFAQALAERGITLVPLSQAIQAKRLVGTAGLTFSR